VLRYQAVDIVVKTHDASATHFTRSAATDVCQATAIGSNYEKNSFEKYTRLLISTATTQFIFKNYQPGAFRLACNFATLVSYYFSCFPFLHVASAPLTMFRFRPPARSSPTILVRFVAFQALATTTITQLRRKTINADIRGYGSQEIIRCCCWQRNGRKVQFRTRVKNRSWEVAPSQWWAKHGNRWYSRMQTAFDLIRTCVVTWLLMPLTLRLVTSVSKALPMWTSQWKQITNPLSLTDTMNAWTITPGSSCS